MATTIKKPPARRRGTKGKPTTKAAPVRNLKQPESEDTKPLQFKVSPELHTEFKTYAAMNGMTMLELFTDAYQFYKSKH